MSGVLVCVCFVLLVVHGTVYRVPCVLKEHLHNLCCLLFVLHALRMPELRSVLGVYIELYGYICFVFVFCDASMIQ